MKIPDSTPLEPAARRPKLTSEPHGSSSAFIDTTDVFTKGDKAAPQFPMPAAQGGDAKSLSHLADLRALKIDPEVTGAIERDLDWRRNEELLRSRIDAVPEHGESLLAALQLAREAHKGQSQKRPQDAEGLDTIPYLNHPVQVANMAFERHLSWQAVEAAILHDVVEDSPFTLADLRAKGFDEKTVALVGEVTRGAGESRTAYMDRVGAMRGDALLLKCLDRYQNLLRSFSVKDAAYLDRYMGEAEKFFVPAFERQPELADLRGPFRRTLGEMRKLRASL